MSTNTQPDFNLDYSIPEIQKTTPPNLPIFIILILILCICITFSALFVTGKIPVNRSHNNQAVIIEDTVAPNTQGGLSDFGEVMPPSPLPITPSVPTPTPTPVPSAKNNTEWVPVAPTNPPAQAQKVQAQTATSTTPAPSTSRVNSIKTYLNGTLHLQGDIADNAEILILARSVGSSDYQPVQRIKAARTINWSWNGATPGTTYEITFAYQINQNNVRTAPVGTAKAPASIETWMNTGSGSSTSSDSNNSSSNTSTTYRIAGIPRLVSCDNYSDGKFSANLKFPRVEGAQQYLIQVGTGAGSVDVYDRHHDQSDGDTYVRLNFENDKNYYLRYSYATCRDCGNSFQGQSVTVEVKCQLKSD